MTCLRLKLTRLACLAALGFILSACTPQTLGPRPDIDTVVDEAIFQQRLFLEDEIAVLIRLEDIYTRVATAAEPFCDRKAPTWGVMALSRGNYTDEERPLAVRLFGLTGTPRVMYIVPGWPADKAGIRKGDFITKIDNIPTSEGADNRRAWYQAIVETPKAATVEIRRDDKTITMIVEPAISCHYPIVRSRKNDINAHADGERTVIYDGMTRFTKNDEELALIIGHELAHNLRHHISDKTINKSIGQTIGVVLDTLAGFQVGVFSDLGAKVGRSAFAVEYETEADYVGLYAVARAGYALDGAPELWRRMGTLSHTSITHASSHPPTAERFTALHAAIKEIREKQAAGLPLLPNEKK